MPNWCDNNLYLSHPDPEMMEKAVNAWNEGKFLATLVPEPDYTKVPVKPTFDSSHITGRPAPEFVDPEQAWWDWRVQNWGTKWDIGWEEGKDKATLDSPTSMFVWFDSAWAPPTDAYVKLVELGFDVKAFYHESGCAFAGRFYDGIDECFSIDPQEGEPIGEWLAENLPKDLLMEMDIITQYEEWEEFNG